MNRVSIICLGVTIPFLATTSACNRPTVDRPKTVHATAVVTYQGQPVEQAMICFIGVNAKWSASGLTDAKGEASLRAFNETPGVVPGDYDVTITTSPTPLLTPDPNDPGSSHVLFQHKGPKLPARYAQKSVLRAVVKDGENNEFTFDLKP